jgi:hypothetical protein
MVSIQDRIIEATQKAREAYGSDLPIDEGVIIVCNDGMIDTHIEDDQIKIDITDRRPILIKIDYNLDLFVEAKIDEH